MSISALEEERDELEEIIASIKTQIERAQAERHESGTYADPKWYAEAKAALRHKGRAHQRVLRAIAELRRAERQKQKAENEKQDLEWCQIFVRVAKRNLGELEFHELSQETDALAAKD